MVAEVRTHSEIEAVQLPDVPLTGASVKPTIVARPPRFEQMVLLPDEVLFGAMPDRRLRFKRPLLVHTERREEGAIARADEIGEFGYGRSTGEALDDLGKTVAELYFSLNAEKDRLSADLETLRLRLDEYIELR